MRWSRRSFYQHIYITMWARHIYIIYYQGSCLACMQLDWLREQLCNSNLETNNNIVSLLIRSEKLKHQLFWHTCTILWAWPSGVMPLTISSSEFGLHKQGSKQHACFSCWQSQISLLLLTVAFSGIQRKCSYASNEKELIIPDYSIHRYIYIFIQRCQCKKYLPLLLCMYYVGRQAISSDPEKQAGTDVDKV
jgi:hypothetical protein